MTIVEMLKSFFSTLFGIKKPVNEVAVEETEEIDLSSIEEEVPKKFELKNVILEKIDYLEQYIKIFSLPFPEVYNKYLGLIQNQRTSYEKELKSYENGFNGNITFSIDPENESKRLIEVIKLENEIKDFVEFEVNYQTHKEKFSKLCLKLNQFYNALIDTKRGISEIKNQLQNANNSLLRLIDEVKETVFFEKDSRKKEDILSYVIYCDYIIFKSMLRCQTVKSLDAYLENESLVYELFSGQDYMRISFEFFIVDLEKLQEYIVKNFSNNTQLKLLLSTSQSLQERLAVSKTQQEQELYFAELIRFENTIDNLVEANNASFEIDAPESIKTQVVQESSNSVNQIAISFLGLMNSITSKVLLKVVASFQYEISWREFYFLCKIFEIYDEVTEFASSTIYSVVTKNFLKMDSKYSQYTEEYIHTNKEKLLRYSGSKSKKYILFMTLGSLKRSEIVSEFDRLRLDYKFVNEDVYLNYSYFNGFKNLQQNFGNYVIM